MKISIRDLSFGFGERKIFDNLSVDISPAPSLFPVVVLGPSGCGKTTLLRLIAGLAESKKGEIVFEGFHGNENEKTNGPPPVSCVFQESRLLPHLSVLKNVSLPLEKIYGKNEARLISLESLKAVSLEERSLAMPDELSGGEKQRAALARAFAYPSRILLMDEPFQSLDIPLRLSLMDLTLHLLSGAGRLAVVITHDPREALYIGSRVIVLGPPPRGIVLDEELCLTEEERAYGSQEAAITEKRLIEALRAGKQKP